MKRTLLVIALCLAATTASASMRCGFKPFPPLGCKIGPCVCDANGNNCQYVVLC